MTTGTFRAAWVLLGALLTACTPSPPPLPAPEQIPPPDPAEVERVVFLVGDAGKAIAEYYPIIPRLQADIEWWAQRLEGDTTVAVLYLGDIVYPLGLHPPDSEEFPHDSAVVMSQVQVLAGPVARARQAQGYFMAGNHDWGLEKEWEGYVRLKNLSDFLKTVRAASGASVQLVPEVGTGGPYVLDFGRHLRILMLDTAWWLLGPTEEADEQRYQVLNNIEQAMRTADGRQVLIAAHHPFRSAGPHGGEFSFWQTFGVRFLLAKSGAILQDLTSLPYRMLEEGLHDIFTRVGPPLIFAGGHEHSLQLINQAHPADPRYSLVSGSASKITGVGGEPGLRFARSTPGYMRLIIKKNGEMSVYVEAAPERFLSCPPEDPERTRCMAEGIAAFETVYSQRLR